MKKVKYFMLFLTGMIMYVSATYFTATHTFIYFLPLSVSGGFVTGHYFYKFITYKPKI